MKPVFTTATAKGLRPYQEDRFVVHQMAGDGALFAVFDGHGGCVTADYCRNQLPQIWNKTATGDSEGRLRNAFAELNVQTQHNHDGAAASLVFIPEGAARAFVAVLGDAPVLIGGKKAIVPVEGQNSKVEAMWVTISPEHNVRSNQKEADAIRDRGGFVSNGYACAQVYGPGLQMSRALGDAELASILSREPEIYSEELDPSCFVLVASDGVFDPSHADTEKAMFEIGRMIVDNAADAQAIVDRAVKLRTGDNATAILVRFE